MIDEPNPGATPPQPVTETPAPRELPPPLESNDTLRRLGIGLVEISPGGVITNSDSIFAKMLKFDSQKALLKHEGPDFDMIFADPIKKNILIQAILREKQPYTTTVTLIGPDNKGVFVSITTYPVLDDQGNVVNIIGIVQETKKTEVKEIQTPICSDCKKVRRVDGSWQDVEYYFAEKVPGTGFSHTICPPCAEKHYPQGLPPKADNK